MVVAEIASLYADPLQLSVDGFYKPGIDFC